MRALIVVALLATAARADNVDQLFQKGKKLLAEKRYKDACATFEKVDKLEPAIGAKLNVAKCYEEWGKLGQAYRWYSDAERMANDTKDKRASKIKDLMVALDPDVPKLTLHVIPADADRVVGAVSLDGVRVPDAQLEVAFRIDPGPHEITYTNPAGKRITKTIPVGRGDQSELTLELPKHGSNIKPPPVEQPANGGATTLADTPPPTTPDPGRNRRLIGLSLGGAGVLGVGIASILTLSARSSYKDALANHCMGKTDLCDDEGLDTTRAARTRANVATAVTVVSLAAIGGGAFLYFTAPRRMRTEHALYVAPHGHGLVVGGRF
jgi:hypothetical protein